MAQSSIPVDLFNPGQVFACLGFMEAAEVLCGEVEGGFDWSDESNPVFELRAMGCEAPFEAVLEFLTAVEVCCLLPKGYAGSPSPQAAAKPGSGRPRRHPGAASIESSDDLVRQVETFPARSADRFALPVSLGHQGRSLQMTHWCDGSTRNPFKLFAGTQRSAAIVHQMLEAVRQLWTHSRDALLRDPVGLTLPLGGSSFKLDARKSWTALDAGYSPDGQGHAVEASPVVELMGALGLEHARPDEFDTRRVRYGVWSSLVPLPLARAFLGAARAGVPVRTFRFKLRLSGKNKIVTSAEEEIRP